MAEVKKCEEHPHLSYYDDLALHAKTAPSGQERYWGKRVLAEGYRAGSTGEAKQKRKSLTRRLINLLRGLAIWALLIAGLIIVYAMERVAAEIVRVETPGTAAVVFQTRLISGLIMIVGMGLPFVGLIAFLIIRSWFWKRYLAGRLARTITTGLAVLMLALVGMLALYDLFLPRHTTIRIDPAQSRVTVTKKYFLKGPSELSVGFEEIQLVEREHVQGKESDRVYINLVLRDGSKVRIADDEFDGYDDVFVALYRVTGRPYELNTVQRK